MRVLIKKWWWALSLAAVIIVISMGASVLSAKNKVVPVEFSEARIEGAKLAQEIVAISSFSLENLKKIAELDREGDAKGALVLISDEVAKNKELQQRAIELSSQLERMAILIPQIEPASARIVATEAISAEVGLVSRLITYNNQFLQLFEVLRAKLQGREAEVSVEALIAKINTEGRAINSLNSKFRDGLAQFDRIFTK